MFVPKSPSISPPSEPRKFEPKSPSISPQSEPRKFEPKSPDFSPPHDEKEKGRPPNSKADFETMVGYYLASNPYISNNRRTNEMEIRFGTNSKVANPISKTDYENVIQYLKNVGFSTENPEGLHILRINSEYYNTARSETVMSNIRAEVVGLDLIQQYCRTNSISDLIHLPSTVSASADKIKFTQKIPPMIANKSNTESKPLKPVDFQDFNFRVSYQMETDYNVRSEIAKRIISSWTDNKKIFRYINRVRFSHPDYPVFADVSIVKASPKSYNAPIPFYTVGEAKLFSNTPHYEIELEIDNSRVGPGTPFAKAPALLEAIRKCIRFVLSGLQGTHYPVAYSEQHNVLRDYLGLIHGTEYAQNFAQKLSNVRNKEEGERRKRELLRHFIGPSSFTLQLENIQTTTQQEGSNVPSILTNYTVTDKADGERKLLYVSPNSRIYMIDTNMKVLFTGAVTRDKDLCNSLLDGEHIKYDKNGKYVNLFAAFDVYYIKEQSVREYSFVPSLDNNDKTGDKDNEIDIKSKFRLPLLNQFVRLLKPTSVLNIDGGNSDPEEKLKAKRQNHVCDLNIKCKDFYTSNAAGGIFSGCSTILSKVNGGTYEYNTDGLIFTPMNTGVASNVPGRAGSLYKTTWEMSFKWKPPKYNTIDFLVSVKKDKTGKDEIHHVFQDGVNLANAQNITQYKTLILMCGFDEKKHGYLNPMLDIINDQLPTPGDIDNEETYKPVPFQPTNPSDPAACLCNIVLQDSGLGSKVMLSEEHEYFEEDMIVEFSYDDSKPAGWKWIPLRVRYDKTDELRSGMKNYGNAYHVANGNWHSIHNPVTEKMITTGQDIPEMVGNDDVYYNRSGKDTNTQGLRDFHNLFVKQKLILGVSHRDDILIDYSVGKAGDMPKWIAAKLRFVFGIDISKHNVEIDIDSAAARYLNYRKKYHKMPGALFVNGNSSLNIRSGQSAISEKDKQITRAVFGIGSKDRIELGEGVYKRYGVAETGFNVSSCQFSIHYFFETEKTLHGFLRNLAECTKLGGYFVGTCYDGQTVFDELKHKNQGDSLTILQRDSGKKIFGLTKQYSFTGFPEDENSTGYAIDVYQESINKVFREYLVNFRYFVRLMDDYGFTLISQEEASAMGLPSPSGKFEELFNMMTTELNRNRSRHVDYGFAKNMTLDEKKISFMNRYFVFKKMRNVNAEKVAKLLLRHESVDKENEELETLETDENKSAPKRVIIRKIRGPKTKVVIRPESDTSEPTVGKSVTIKVKRHVKK